MQHSLLLQTFRTLTRYERNELRKMVASPFFNRRDDVSRLFEFLCSRVPESKPGREMPADISKTETWQYVFAENLPDPQRAYDDEAMRYAMSFLFRIIKDYLAYTRWKGDESGPGRYLCRALRERGLMRVFEREYAALQEQEHKTVRRSADWFLNQYQIRLEYREFFSGDGHRESPTPSEVNEPFEAFVASSVLRQACALLALPGEKERVETIAYLPATLAAAENGRFDHQPAVLAWFHCFRIISGGSEAEAHFAAQKKLLETHWQSFPGHETRDLYVAAINFCIRRLNAGAREYVHEALSLYRIGLERKTILEDGRLNKYTYNNIMLLAIAAGEWEWARQFLDDFRVLLPRGDRESAFHYNLAIYFFRKKDFGQAQETLREVEFRDIFYNLDARRMLVRIYFDSGEVAALESLLDSFNMYIRRKRASIDYHKELNSNFIRFTKKLIRLEPGDDASAKRLYEKIRAEKYVAEREWLLQKVDMSAETKHAAL